MKCSMKGGEMWGYPNHALCVDIFLKDCACEYAVVIGCDVLWPDWHLRKNNSAHGIFEKNAGEFNISNIGFNKNKIYSILKNIDEFWLAHSSYFSLTIASIFCRQHELYVIEKVFSIVFALVDIFLNKLKF